jgi:intracellular sulfur oxidation DsrE/DsrF family protein
MAQIEVVAHNKGISMLLKEKTNIQPQLTELKAQGITFLACENTLRQQKLEKSQIVGESGFVPGGLIHIVERQEEGWSYIKGGF